MNILVYDVGTTSIRGVVYADGIKEADIFSIQTPLITDAKTGYIEQSADTYVSTVIRIAKHFSEKYPIDAVTLTAFRSAPTLVDEQGNAMRNFIMWQDTRNREICTELSRENDTIYHKSGAKVNTVFTASKLIWIKRNEPELWQKAYKAMIVPDYIAHMMTGEFATDTTYGSRTHVMNIHTLQWDDELCSLFEIGRDKLCELHPQGCIIGKINSRFAALSGLKQGTPVISAGGDQQCGALGLGVMDSHTIEVNSGTGSFVISLVDRPYLENTNVICNVAAVPGMYTQEMNIISTASALNWLIREFFPEYWGDQPDFAAINRIAGQTPAGCNGLRCIPHFQGCGSRDWNPHAHAVFSGMSLCSKRNDFIRALYEGIAAEIAKSIDALPPICRRAEAIAVAGGLSKSDVYNQILCDMTDRRLNRGQNLQATARGACVSAAVTLGLYPDYVSAIRAACEGETQKTYIPNPENTKLYKEYKKKTECLYRADHE